MLGACGSGRHLAPTPSLLYAFQTFFGLNEADSKVFEHTNISTVEARLGFSTNHPDPSGNVEHSQPIVYAILLR